MTTRKKKSKSKLAANEMLTPPVRMSFVHIAKRRKYDENDSDDEGTYQITLLIPPDAPIAPYRNLERRAIKQSKWGAGLTKAEIDKFIKKKGSRIQDAGDEEYEGYEEGWRFIRLSSYDRPQVVGRERDEDGQLEDLDAKDIYSGCWARVRIDAYGYSNKFGKGVKFSFSAVQFWRDDDPFSGRARNPAEAFDDVEFDDEDDFEEEPRRKKKKKRRNPAEYDEFEDEDLDDEDDFDDDVEEEEPPRRRRKKAAKKKRRSSRRVEEDDEDEDDDTWED